MHNFTKLDVSKSLKFWGLLKPRPNFFFLFNFTIQRQIQLTNWQIWIIIKLNQSNQSRKNVPATSFSLIDLPIFLNKLDTSLPKTVQCRLSSSWTTPITLSTWSWWVTACGTWSSGQNKMTRSRPTISSSRIHSSRCDFRLSDHLIFSLYYSYKISNPLCRGPDQYWREMTICQYWKPYILFQVSWDLLVTT